MLPKFQRLRHTIELTHIDQGFWLPQTARYQADNEMTYSQARQVGLVRCQEPRTMQLSKKLAKTLWVLNQKIRRNGELNPGLPRDRREY